MPTFLLVVMCQFVLLRNYLRGEFMDEGVGEL
jgi:hypothetical protein